MNLTQALALRQQLRQPELFDDPPKGHGVYIFHVFPESFHIALVGNEQCGDTLEELQYVEEWIENEGFDNIYLANNPSYIDLDWTLVESWDHTHASAYSMVQRLAVWSGYIDRYNKNPHHNAWPKPEKPSQLQIFFQSK